MQCVRLEAHSQIFHALTALRFLIQQDIDMNTFSRRTVIAVLAAIGSATFFATALADEGMWMPQQLPALEDRLEDLGLELDPETLTDLTAHPMGAVISLGGCTASFVSPKGLVVTNHHCAYGSIQYNSTEENNLLENGFLAEDFSAELPAAPGSRIYVTESLEDVTASINAAIPENATGAERYDAIEAAEKALIAECESTPGYHCNVYAYHGGLYYYLIKQLEIRDVRLVYAPSHHIGKFGGDIDNWMWPRHTGDFSFYRAYVGPDGKPAAYSEDNVPFEPKHWLTVSTQGLDRGDYVMVVGYPGNTDRYRLAAEVKNAFEWVYPTRRKTYLEWLGVIEKATADNEAAAIKYASLVAGLNNVIKNYQGKMEGYAEVGTLARKQARDVALAEWIHADAEREQQYGDALQELEALVARDIANQERDLRYGLATNSSLLEAAGTLYRLSIEKQKPDAEREPGYQQRDLPQLRADLEQIERRFAPAVDKAVWKNFILDYAKLPAAQRVESFDKYFGIGTPEFDEAALTEQLDRMYAETGLDESDARLAWLEKGPEAFRQSDDPFIELAVAIFDANRDLEDAREALAGEFAAARPRYMDALIAWKDSQGEPVYPDANSTLRVTFGTVQGYEPRDAVRYLPFTTLAGIVEKHRGEWPFDVPLKLLDAIGDGNYGPYFDSDVNSVPVNFLANLDITGGNSGSPTLNEDGELVGLIFDMTYEGIISDWDYAPEQVRSIHVSALYMLWIMDAVDDADRLLIEMGIEPELE